MTHSIPAAMNKELKGPMEPSFLRLTNPGKCGFFMLGMFFMLALASWTLVTRSRIPQEIVDNQEYLGEEDARWSQSGSTFENVLTRQASQKQRLSERLQARLGSARAARTVGARTLEEENEEKGDGDRDAGEQQFERTLTFLSTMEFSFKDVHPDANGEIPTVEFLQACAGPKDLLTGLGRIMTQVWSDVGGNIKKLHSRYESNPSQYASLESIVRVDIQNGIATNDDSSAMAVLWLKRAFDFVAAFFDNIQLGKNPHTAAVDAYQVTLSPYHSFWVKPIFYTGMKMLGPVEDVLSAMALHPEDLKKEGYRASAFRDMEEYSAGMRELLSVLDRFMRKNDLNI